MDLYDSNLPLSKIKSQIQQFTKGLKSTQEAHQAHKLKFGLPQHPNEEENNMRSNQISDIEVDFIAQKINTRATKIKSLGKKTSLIMTLIYTIPYLGAVHFSTSNDKLLLALMITASTISLINLYTANLNKKIETLVSILEEEGILTHVPKKCHLDSASNTPSEK